MAINASYSYYDRDPYRDKGGVKVRGKLDASILLYTDDRGGYFIRERVERYLLNTPEGRRRESGFRLVWSEGFSSRHLDTMEERIVQALTGSGDDDRREDEDGGTTGGDGAGTGDSDRGKGDSGGKADDDGRPSDEERVAERPETEEGETTEEQGIEVSRSDEGVVVNLPDIHFVPDQARILPDERGRLDKLAELLRQVPDATFLVKGHTADVGSEESQIALSKERAKTIIDELEKRGFASSRFIYRGLGGSEPVATNETEEGRAKNRRVEIVVLPK
jgi:outer membrane protein OmpA-like peptidoglycan-associated protein